MLWNASELTGYGLEATDGAIGTVSDFLFDDKTWTIRWFVVGTGVFFAERRVLLPASALLSVDPAEGALAVDATRQQVKDSPDIDFDAPVSRQQEGSLYDHYGWNPYWGPHMYFSPGDRAPVVPPQPDRPEEEPVPTPDTRTEGDPHLRSIGEVTGYNVHATDGDIGHIEDFLLDSDGWVIRYVVVDTVNWWPGRNVLVSPIAFTDVVWATHSVNVNLARRQIRDAPDYYAGQAVDRAYEALYHDHYGYPHYWK